MTTFLVIVFLVLLVIIGVLYLMITLREIKSTNQEIAQVEKRHYTLLSIRAPRNNQKSPLAAEQMFTAIHGIYRASVSEQEHFSFEIAATTTSIQFYMLVPTHLRDFIEGQVYSQYPTVEIEAASDYANLSLEGKSLAAAEVVLAKNDFYPIRTFTNFDVDPLAGITGVLSKVDEGEILAIQAVLSPIDESWQKDGLDYVKKVKEGKSVAPPAPLRQELAKQGKTFVTTVAKEVAAGILTAPKKDDKKEKKEEKKEVKLSGPEEAALKGIESKVVKLGYAVSIRVLAVTKDPLLSQTRVESVVGAFKQFNVSNLNGFTIGEQTDAADYLRIYRSRNHIAAPYRLNVEEIASMFHLPGATVETPNISWAGSKKGEPPQNLPIEGEVESKELTTFGLTSFRNRRTKFGIKALDRRLHFYIIGKTGTGKSTLIENMIYDDIKEGRGVAVVDPHGELIEHVLNFIPEERIKDVVYFNPDDREHPLAFNLLENIDPDMRSVVASGLMSIFTKLWANVWSARMEYILRNSILAALEVPEATLLSIMRILNDPIYRKYALSFVTDPVVRDFFINEYDKYDAKFRQEAIAPIQNKVGQFLSSSTVRNLVGQPKSTFNVSDIMDSGKIFLVNLSIGRIGEDNSKLLGSMMITKIQLAAMERARVKEDQRRDFYVYVDEFQNFATDSFAVILSEARKYHLNLVLVNQYIAQIPEVVADAIFGNVGTMVSFRVGPEDAERLVKQYAPVFEANDLINLPNRQIYVKMAIDGVTSQSFSAHTLPPRGTTTHSTDAIIEASRTMYARNRGAVESAINEAATAEFRSELDNTYEDIRTMRPLIMDGTMYKEFSAKGGDRWYFGQPPEILAEELAKLAEEQSTGQGSATVEPKQDITPTVEIAPIASPSQEIIAAPSPEAQAVIVAPESSLPALVEPEEGTERKKKKKKKKKKLEGSTEETLVIQKEVSIDNPVSVIVTKAEEAVPARALKLPTPPQVAHNLLDDVVPVASEPAALPMNEEKTEENHPEMRSVEVVNEVMPIEEKTEALSEENRVGDEVIARNRGQQEDDWLPIEEV